MSARGFARLCWLVAVIVVFVSPTQAQQPPATALSKAQLEQLVAPIALHPDALLSQMLMASTYPTEVVQAARWARENPGTRARLYRMPCKSSHGIRVSRRSPQYRKHCK